jgi:hypothetical protein
VTPCITRFIQTFPDWPPGARTVNGTALCHWMQLYRYFMSQSSQLCCHNPLCFFSTSFYYYYYYYCLFRYLLSPEAFGYILVLPSSGLLHPEDGGSVTI